MDNKNNLMYIMSGDVKTVEFNEAFEFNILDEARAPIYIINKGNIKKWIEERAVYSIRPNSRALKSVQGLSKLAADYDTAMKVDAAVITDNYWIGREQDIRQYKDIVFTKNDFFTLALYRDITALSSRPGRSPELTNIGTQEKGWKLENGEWWLYKNEPVEEVVSEYIAYRLGKAMGYRMAEYEIVDGGKFIKTKDFTQGKYNLQHIDSIVSDHREGDKIVPDDDYKYNYLTLKEIDEKLAEEYISICILDAICENYDRHTKNYGLLTDSNTGKIISLAPNYDNNNSILANYGITADHLGGLLQHFIRFVKENRIPLKLPSLSKKTVEQIVEETYALVNHDFDQKLITNFIISGYNKLKAVN